MTQVQETPVAEIPEADELRERLGRDVAFAARAMMLLYAEQTEAERFAGDDLGVRNGRGFSPFDAAPLSRIAERIEQGERSLERREVDTLLRLMPKYAGQLRRLKARQLMESSSARLIELFGRYGAAKTREAKRIQTEIASEEARMEELRKIANTRR